MTTAYPTTDIEKIDDLLRISPKDHFGASLIKQWGSLSNLMLNLDTADLTDRQRRVLRAAFSIRLVSEEKPTINSPADAAALVKDLEIEPKENLVVLCFDRRNQLIHRENLYVGSVSSSQVRVGEIFKAPIVRNASSIVVAHNHPSGDPTPSPDDVALTRALIQAGKLLDIEVLDHVVIGLDRFVSLKERGLGFS